MALEAERLEILRLVEAGQVSVDDGARLLAALDREAGPARASANAPTARGATRWFKLRVEEPSGQQVNVALPLVAIPVVLRVAARWLPAEYRTSLDAAAASVNSEYRGDLVLTEEPNGQRVRLWIE